MSLPDSTLIARVLVDDDLHAFGELVRRHQSTVRAFLRRLTGGRDVLADDLAQEAFTEAYRQLARFRGDAMFSTWLLGIAYNRFRSARRAERPVEPLLEDTAMVESPQATEDLKQDLASAMALLSGDESAAIQLCYGNGLTHEEASTVLGSPLGTVKTHLRRAKEKLRQRLRAWAPAG